MCYQASRLYRKDTSAVAQTNVPLITSNWFVIYRSSTFAVMDEARAIAGNFGQQVRWQFASVLTSQPEGWDATGTSTRTSNGAGSQQIDISGEDGSDDFLWGRVGLAGRVSAAGVGEAVSGLRAVTQRASRLIVKQRVIVNPYLNSTEEAFIPLGVPLPSLTLTGYMFAVVVSGVDGTVTFQPAWRTFSAIPSDPGTWTAIGTAQNPTSNTLWNSKHLSVSSSTSVFLAQPGLKITSTDARAILDVMVAGAGL